MAFRELPRIDVFALEDRCAQISWAWLPTPEMTVEIGGQEMCVGSEAPVWYAGVGLQGWARKRSGRRPRLSVRGAGAPGSPGSGEGWAGGRARPAKRAVVAAAWTGPRTRDVKAGPGAVTIAGLEPATSYDVVLRGPNRPRTLVARLTTLPPPPGQLLSRFATISDCHIGERSIGLLHMFRDPEPRPPGLAPYPVRCAEAAIAEAVAWGAGLLIAKGDLTYDGEVDEVRDAARILRGASVPVEVILGNHDVRGPADTPDVLAAHGLPMSLEPRARDLPGVRLVLGHSPLPDRHAGAVTPADISSLAQLTAETTDPVVVALHHPPSRWPVQTHYPPSIVWHDTTRLVDALAAANPATLIVAGHTHRNRRYPVRGLTVAEVASTKDYPGVWAGYSVYEGGIRQVVYRVADPAAIAWTQVTRRALGGIWGWWSPGRMSDRCWTLEWAGR